MKNPRVVRIKRNKQGIIQGCDLYIGRAINYGGWNLPQSKWHNPFTVKKYGNAGLACWLYLEYIIKSDLFHDLPELAGLTLGCWCDYQCKKFGFYCHGAVLLELFKLVKYYNFDTKMVQSVLRKNI